MYYFRLEHPSYVIFDYFLITKPRKGNLYAYSLNVYEIRIVLDTMYSRYLQGIKSSKGVIFTME